MLRIITIATAKGRRRSRRRRRRRRSRRTSGRLLIH